jgi:hypothetical protein
MPTNYLRAIGYCLLGGGAALAIGSINHLYRMSESTAKYRGILAPHLASVPDGGVYSDSAAELDQKFAVQISSADTLELKFFQKSSEGGADAGTTRAVAIGGVILMGIGMALSNRSQCKSQKNREAEQAGRGDGDKPSN